MTYKIKITDNALKQYQKINNPYHNLIKQKIDSLSISGLELSNIKALTGEFKGLYRLRIGDYRVIFDIEKYVITIIAILHRKDACK